MARNGGRRISPVDSVALGLYVFVLLASLAQDPGRTTYDTRIELTERPASFLAEAFRLWHPGANFGEIQNQGYGYLFPQGPFFLLGEASGLPDWVTQRIWTALVLVIACEGARRVGRVLELGPAVALLVGVVFAFSPRLLGTVPVLTAESLPGAVLPWVLLPVLLALRGRLRWGAAAVLSGAAVLFMGGVNAVENLAVLPLPGLVVLWAVVRGLAPLRFLAQWLACLAAAAVWWIVPLLLAAPVSPRFFEYVESARNTTSLVGMSESVRGSSHWVAYLLAGDQAWWPAAFALVTDPALVMVSAVIAGVGFAGLSQWRSALRTPFLLSALLGVGILAVGHGGLAGSAFSELALHALDGPLQMFRNVHKFDPLVRLPVAIGFGVSVTLLVHRLTRRVPRLASSRGLLVASAGLLPLVLGQPYLANQARSPGWTELPAAWIQARDYLAEHAAGTSTLVVPGSGFALHDWGWTLDEPLLALDLDGRVIRSQVPLVPGQSIRYLSELDRLITTGSATSALGEQLGRAGIGHVVLRRDLDVRLTGSPVPAASAVSLRAAGLRPVREFGKVGSGDPQVEVYQVPVVANRVTVTPLSQVKTVRGAPETVLALQDEDLVEPEVATVLAGEDAWNAPVSIVTDAPQRRERAFGAVTDALSAIMTTSESFRVARAVHDFPTTPRERQTTADFGDGVAAVTASSSQGYADTYGPVLPQASPYSAFDGDLRSRWVSSPASLPTRQWLRLEFGDVQPVHEVRVVPGVGDANLIALKEIEVAAGGVRRQLEVNPTGTTLVADLDGVKADHVEIRVVEVVGRERRGAIALREVSIDGVDPVRALVVPEPLRSDASLLLSTSRSVRACRPTLAEPDCDVARIRDAEESTGLDRIVDVADPRSLVLSGAVVARGTRASSLLLEPLDGSQRVGATSVYGDDPQVSSRFLYDGDLATAWVSDPADPQPTVFVNWDRPRQVTSLRIRSQGDLAATPRTVVVRANGRATEYTVPGDTLLRIRPVRTRNLELSFPRVPDQQFIRVSEVELGDVGLSRPLDAATPVAVVCGFGPNLYVDGRRVLTRVTGTLADVMRGTPLTLSSCGRGRVAELLPGPVRLKATRSAEFEVIRVTGRPADPAPPGPSPQTAEAETRSVEVRTWRTARRTIRVGGGEASVLTVAENANPGWQATAYGRPLQTVRIDGWRQGWLLPAGGSTVVDLVFAPESVYRWGLRASLTVSGLLGLVAAVLLIGRRKFIVIATPRHRAGSDAAADAADTVFDARPGTWPPAQPWARRAAMWLCAGTAVLLGSVAAVGMAGAFVMRRTSVSALAVLGGVMMVASGLVDAFAAVDWHREAADGLAALAVGGLAGVAIRGKPRALARPVWVRLTAPWTGPQGLAAAAVITGGLIWRTVLQLGSFFNQDDYYLTARAAETSLTWDFLFTPVAGHVMPAQQLVYWLIARLAPFNWPVLAWSIVLVQLAGGILWWHLLGRLLPGRWVRIPLLAVFVLSPLTLVTTLWWSAAMGLWPHVIAALLALTFLVRQAQGRGSAALNTVGVLASFVGGLAWHERSILVPVLVAGAALALAEGRGRARIRDAFRTHRPVWMGLVGLGIAYLVTHRLLTTVESQPASWRDRWEISWAFLAENAVPGVISGPWQAELQGGAVVPATWPTVVGLVAAAAGTWLLWRRGGAGRGWALTMLAAYTGLGLAMLLLGRAGFGRIIGLDPRYSSDLVLAAVVAAALALHRPRATISARHRAPVRHPVLALGGAAVYVAGAAVTTAVLVPHFQNVDDRTYLTNLHASLRADPEQVVFDAPVPANILLPLLGEETMLSRVLAPDPDRPIFDRPTQKLRMVDPAGVPRPTTLAFETPAQAASDADCDHPVVSGERTTVRLVTAWRGRGALRVGYFTDTEADVRVRSVSWSEEFRARPGPNVVWLTLPGEALRSTFSFELASGGGTVCLADVSAGGPMVQP